jgi:hypothetical protein
LFDPWNYYLVFILYLVSADCGGSADVIFAVPGNGKIPGEEFFPFEKFLTMLVDYFRIDRDNVNIGDFETCVSLVAEHLERLPFRKVS